MKAIKCVVLLVALIAIAPSNSLALSNLNEDAIKKEFENKELIVSHSLTKANAGFGSIRGIDYYYLKSISRIWFDRESIPLMVESVNVQDDDIAFELKNKVYGNGTVKIYFNKVDSKKVQNADVIAILNKIVSDEERSIVIVDRQIKKYHLTSSNHLPSADNALKLDVEAAKKQGFAQCNVCFANNVLHLPDSEFESSIAHKIVLEFSHYTPVERNSEKQLMVNKIGRKVLNAWPFKLLGYNYEFRVIDSEDIRSYSIPGAVVYITTGLLRSVDSDEEIEALLAREIAHVEKRHALRSYYNEMAESRSKTMFGLAMGVMAGGLMNSNRKANAMSGEITALALTTLTGAVAMNLYFGGYSKELEYEADELAFIYFTKNKLDVNNLRKVIKMSMYKELLAHNEYNLAKINQPYEKNLRPYDEERLRQLEASYQYKEINQSYLFINRIMNRYQPPIEVKLLYTGVRKGKSIIAAYIGDSSWGKDNVNCMLHRETKSGYVTYVLDKDIVKSDAWGAYAIFTAQSQDKIDANNLGNLSMAIDTQDAIMGSSTTESSIRANLIKGTLNQFYDSGGQLPK